MRTRTLHGVHHTATLEQLIEMHAAQQSGGALLDHLRHQIAGKENHERTEQRGDEFPEQREALLETFRERRRKCGLT